MDIVVSTLESLQEDAAKKILEHVEGTKTDPLLWSDLANRYSAQIRFYLEQGVFSHKQLLGVIARAIVTTSQQEIEQSYQLRHYADHYLDPKALAYTLYYYEDEVDVDKIHFDHGDTVESYIKQYAHKGDEGEDYAQYLYQQLLQSK